MGKKVKSTNTFTARLDRFNSNLWHFHIMVPDTISKAFIDNGDKRVICTLNGQIEFQCALMPAGNDSYFINLNKKIRDTLGLEIGSEVDVHLIKDESQYGLPMPEELNELLQMDDEGNKLFHDLTPGKQRTLLHIIGTPKNSDSRIRRAICVVNHLKDTKGKINYRVLNEMIKNSR